MSAIIYHDWSAMVDLYYWQGVAIAGETRWIDRDVDDQIIEREELFITARVAGDTSNWWETPHCYCDHAAGWCEAHEEV